MTYNEEDFISEKREERLLRERAHSDPAEELWLTAVIGFMRPTEEEQAMHRLVEKMVLTSDVKIEKKKEEVKT